MPHKPTPFTPDDPSFAALVTEAASQGHGFVGRFAVRWLSGDFLFDQPGEKLLAIRHNHQIAAFGGICVDPYTNEPNAGRLRHLYVLKEWRGHDLGRTLVGALTARPHPFAIIRLRTDDAASAFYERLGWKPCNAENATHELVFNP